MKTQVWKLAPFLVGTTGIMVVIMKMLNTNETFSPVDITLVVALGLVVLAYIGQLVITQLTTPGSLTISMLGYPNSGKSVFLTILFNELGIRKYPGFLFTPYGSETAQEVSRNLSLLMGGYWLPRTKFGDVFPYRAYVNQGSGFLRRKYKIEIGDYAGEHLVEFNCVDKPELLYQNDYFKYVIQSEIVFMVIDGDILREKASLKIDNAINNLIAAIQIVMSEKGVAYGRKMKTPVALLILKSDLLQNKNRMIYDERISRLVSYCSVHCANFEVFWTSAVAATGKDNKIIVPLKSKGVSDPLLWAMKKI